MSAPESTPRRVALLARPGAARDSVRGALIEIGADIVVEDDPTAATPDSVRDASPQVLMIVLDAVSESALDRFESMLGDPQIEVMFEEADVAAGRDGWEAARWRRHLAAKLHHRSDVLPPVAGAETVPAVDPLAMQLEEFVSADIDGTPTNDPVADVVELPMDASGGQDFSVFDPVAAEGLGDGDAGDLSLTIHGLELDSAPLDALPPVTGPNFSASDFDPLLAELDAELPDVPLPDMPELPPLPESDWQGGLVEGFGEASSNDVAPTSFDSTPTASEGPAVPPPLPPMSFGELSLADDAMPVPSRAPAAAAVDLGDLERRIAALELVDDTPAVPAGSAPFSTAEPTPFASGIALVLAGIGGPDAVRQFLGALPARFGAAVLVRQRLDGARYDKLVAQMQRASALPVVLAVAGEVIRGGHVYVLGDDVGITQSAVSFSAGDADRMLERLPMAQAAVLVLSGADAGDAERVAALQADGLLVGAQTADGCYDAAAAQAVAARGAVVEAPSDLARRIVDRWA